MEVRTTLLGSMDYVDVLITANPKALAAKPEGKIAVKVNASYNKDSEADFEIDNIIDIFDNEENFYEIINND